jgi:hypothetical protein
VIGGGRHYMSESRVEKACSSQGSGLDAGGVTQGKGIALSNHKYIYICKQKENCPSFFLFPL